LTHLPDEFDKFLEHINELHYEDKPDYDFLRSVFISSIQRLGYQDDDPYDWEKSTEQDQFTKIEQQKISSQDNERKTIPENSLKRNTSRSPTPNPTEYLKNNRQLNKPSSRTDLLKKQTDSNHHVPLHQPTHHRQQSPYGFDRIKLDSVGTGDQQQIINHKKLSAQPETRSPDTLTRRSTHLNINDRGQSTNNGLLTYISQQFSNAVAPGTPSLISQWSPHNGETLTDDDILKGNKSSSSRADERATTLSGERTSPVNIRLNHPNSSIKNNSAGQTPFVSDNEEYYLSLKHQQNIQIPFGTYIKNTRRNNNHYRRQTSPSFRKKI
jgi:hypothetical protein